MDPPAVKDTAPAHATLVLVFVAAVAIRWTYDLGLYLTMGLDGLITVDSIDYLERTRIFAGRLAGGSTHDLSWLGPSVYMMPLFSWVLIACQLAFGPFAALGYVLFQGVLDAATCLVIYFIARSIAPPIAVWAAIAACLNPTQIVLSGLVLSDTPFVLLVAVSLLGTVRWLTAPDWPSAVLIGAGLGAASLIRALVLPWLAAILLMLLVIAAWQRRLSIRSILQLAMAGVLFALMVGPLLARNVTQYQSWQMTPQSGLHLNWWVVPLVTEARDGTPFLQSLEVMQKRTRDRFGPETGNPFESSRQEAAVAIDELKVLGPLAILKAWTYGTILNIGAPAATLVPLVSKLPRTGFYDTHAQSMTDKIADFIFRSDNKLYAMIVLASGIGLAATRLVQAIGLVVLLRESGRLASVLVLGCWCLFVLAVNGPVASPKYRLPMEPVLMVLAGAGLHALRLRRGTSLAGSTD